jgi:fructoselysine-6-P-deglycase FrlB-like protein
MRPIDERALRFLENHTDSLVVLDSYHYGMSAVENQYAPILILSSFMR